jgi:hypothetical protein
MTVKKRRWPIGALPLMIPLAFGVVCPFLTFDHYLSIVKPWRAPVDPITQNEIQLSAVKAALPVGQAVGYLDASPPGDPNRLMRYYLAQYALAPTLLIADPQAEWQLLRVAPDAPPVQTDPHYRKVQDFGNGLSLFRRVRP